MEYKVTSHNNGSHAFMEVEEEEELVQEAEEEIELVVQGRTISVSERMLCEHSGYFRKIFHEFNSGSQETIVLRHSKVAGEDLPLERQQEPLALISFVTMVTIVDFLYTGSLVINDQNVRQLLYASDLLTMGLVEAECFAFLKEQLTVKNCVKSFKLASAKKSWRALANFIKKFIIQHFDQIIAKTTAIFKLLDVDDFRSIISSPCLSVVREERVVDSVLDWVGGEVQTRGQHLASLLREVQWQLVRSPAYFTDLLNDPNVREDKACSDLMEEGLKYFNLSYQEKVKHWSDSRPKPSRWPKMIAALSYAEKLIECFDFEEEAWFVMTEKPGYVFGSTMVTMKGQLYTLGGVQSKTVDRYDVESDSWSDFFPSLRHCRVAHGVVATEDKIFVSGGSAKANANFGPGLYEMECLEVSGDGSGEKKPVWRDAGVMKEARSFLGSAVLDDRIFQIGGCLSEDNSSMEVWDPVTRKFTDCASSLSKRDSQGQAVVDGQLYVVGGYDNIANRYLDTVEKYNPTNDRWSKVSKMSLARRSAGVVAYRDRLYVVAGMGEDSDLSSVETFCPLTNQWAWLPSEMKEVNGWCSACLVDKPVRLMELTKPVLERTSSDSNGLDSDSSCSSDSRRASLASMTSSSSSRMDWTCSENARTEQRLKRSKELTKLFKD